MKGEVFRELNNLIILIFNRKIFEYEKLFNIASEIGFFDERCQWKMLEKCSLTEPLWLNKDIELKLLSNISTFTELKFLFLYKKAFMSHWSNFFL